jgi:phosphate transport system substrate-binding protein
VLDYVSAHQGAVGYLSLGYLGPGIAAVSIDGASPTLEVVEEGSYPLTRPFLLVSRVELNANLTAFMQFARGPAGQAIVQRTYGSARVGPQ